MQKVFNPEFLNRLDERVLPAQPLSTSRRSSRSCSRTCGSGWRRGDAQAHRGGHGLPGEARLRRELRRPAAEAGDPALHRGSALGEDPAGRVLAGRRDRGGRRAPTGRSSTSGCCRARRRRSCRTRATTGRPAGSNWDLAGLSRVYCRSMRRMLITAVALLCFGRRRARRTPRFRAAAPPDTIVFRGAERSGRRTVRNESGWSPARSTIARSSAPSRHLRYGPVRRRHATCEMTDGRAALMFTLKERPLLGPCSKSDRPRLPRIRQ